MDVQSLDGIAPWDWPEEAGQVIRSALADRRGEPADRLLAAEMAGSILVMDDAMAEVLLEIVPSVVSPKSCCYSEPDASALDRAPSGALVVGTPCRSYGYAASFRLARTAPPAPR